MTVTVPRRFRFAPILTATVLTVLLLYLFGKTANIFLLLFVAVLISLYLGAVAEVFQQRLRLPPRVALGAAIALTTTGSAATRPRRKSRRPSSGPSPRATATTSPTAPTTRWARSGTVAARRGVPP